MTRPLPKATAGTTLETYSSEAATDGGTILIGHAWQVGRVSHEELLSFDRNGNPGPTIPLTGIFDVAVAGTRTYLLGGDAATPAGGETLFAFEGTSLLWRADGPAGLSGKPLVAGAVVYVQELQADRNVVRAYAADGCGAASCPPVTVVDPGAFSPSPFGYSVTFGTLFVSAAGPVPQLIAFTPSA